jgi:phosphoribosylformimino-5-aminoimidazole carboxamide ribotide isomerase
MNAWLQLIGTSSHSAEHIQLHFVLQHARMCCMQVKLVGKQRLVLDLSCRQRDGQYWVVTDRWQRFSSLALSEATLAQLADSCDEFLVHGVDVEGMQLGIDDALVELLGKWSPIPVTYAGGARTLVSVAYHK